MWEARIAKAHGREPSWFRGLSQPDREEMMALAKIEGDMSAHEYREADEKAELRKLTDKHRKF
jgi:hypothetical protein